MAVRAQWFLTNYCTATGSPPGAPERSRGAQLGKEAWGAEETPPGNGPPPDGEAVEDELPEEEAALSPSYRICAAKKVESASVNLVLASRSGSGDSPSSGAKPRSTGRISSGMRDSSGGGSAMGAPLEMMLEKPRERRGKERRPHNSEVAESTFESEPQRGYL
jgi:hypothetical protein